MLRIVSNTRLIEYKPRQKPFCIPIKINVKEITLIKHTRDGWKVFSKHKKIFALCDRRDSYPIEFYKWIVEKSCCEEERPKGYVGRNDKF